MSNQSTKSQPRRYRKRRRAELEARTRQRITEAAMRLHGTVGPARTTVKAVAEEAGVQRATVYRHFPDEESLFMACSSHWAQLNPPPDLTAWATIQDAQERLRVALTELYDWYAWGEQMLVNTTRDAPLVPSMRQATVVFTALFEEFVKTLMRGRPERGRRRARVAAAIGHALAFPTWYSLVREQGIDQDEAVELMMGLVACA